MLVELHLVVDRVDVPDTLRVARELRHVLHHPLDDLDVTFTEGRHQARHLAVVLGVDVGAGVHEQLYDVQVAACRREQRQCNVTLVERDIKSVTQLGLFTPCYSEFLAIC